MLLRVGSAHNLLLETTLFRAEIQPRLLQWGTGSSSFSLILTVIARWGVGLCTKAPISRVLDVLGLWDSLSLGPAIRVH